MRVGGLGITCLILIILLGGVTGVVGSDALELNDNESELDSGGHDIEIDAALEDSDGETTVLVHLEDRPDAAVQATTDEHQVESMQSHANDTQTPFERFAAGNPHVEIERQYWVTNAALVTVDTDRVPLERLGTVDHVTDIHDNFEVESHHTTAPTDEATVCNETDDNETVDGPNSEPDDEVTPHTGDHTWGLEQIDAPNAWETFDTRGEGSSVAVLDTGVDGDHPDIDIDDENWRDFDDEPTSDPHDYDSHGTHVSGTVAGGNESGESIGVAPEAELLHGAVLTNCDNGACSGTVGQILDGMEWALEEDADVISLSLGSDGYTDLYIDPIRNAESAGTLVVSSSGNDGPDTSGSPGNVYEAFSVGASTEEGDIAGFSSGETIDTESDWESVAPDDWPESYTVPDVTAPGEDITSAVPVDHPEFDDEYRSTSGTSMAAPHASGSAAIVQSSTEDERSPAELRSTLEDTATSLEEDEERAGAGQIDVYEAVLQTLEDTLDPEIEVETAQVGESTAVSVEADHSFESYDWEVGGESIDEDGSQIEHTFDEVGEESIDVTMSDGSDLELTTSTAIDVIDERSPTAALEVNRTEDVEVGIDAVEFDASESTDNDGIAAYEWTVDGDRLSNTTDPTIEHTFDEPGTHSVTVTAVDESGNENTTSVPVDVVDTTDPTPALDAPGNVSADWDASFDASDSTDNHEIDTYTWDFDDGTTTTTTDAVENHSFDDVGSHTVNVTAVDPSGNIAVVEETIQVHDPPSVSLTEPANDTVTNESNVTVEYDLENTNVADAAGVEHRVLDANSTDDGADEWTDGDFTETGTSNTSTFAATTGDLDDGTYEVELRLVDEEGTPLPHENATDSRTVTVDTTPPTVTLDVDPADESYDEIGSANPASINVNATDENLESTTVAITPVDEDTEDTEDTEAAVKKWDRSDATGGEESTAIEWPATDSSDEPVDSGNYTITLSATDTAGNENATSETVTVDTDDPTLSFETIVDESSDESGEVVHANDSSEITVTGKTTDGGSTTGSVSDVSVTLESTDTTYRHEVPAEYDKATHEWDATIEAADIPDDGRYVLAATTEDSANNTVRERADGPEVDIDRTSPTLTAVVSDVDDAEAVVDVHSSEALDGDPTVDVTDADGTNTTVENLTQESEHQWNGSIDVDPDGRYDLTASGTDLAGNAGNETTTVSLETDPTTDDGTVTIYNEQSGAFLTMNATEDVSASPLALSETDTAPTDLDSSRLGVEFLTAGAGDALDRNMENATIGIPTDEAQLPEGVSVDDDTVGLQQYDEETGQWDERSVDVESFENGQGPVGSPDSVDGEYWIATVDDVSTYGITVEDTSSPNFVESVPEDGTTIDEAEETATIEFAYEDNVTGIDASSVDLSVTQEEGSSTALTDDDATQITTTETVHEDFDVEANSTYTATLTVSDHAGNEAGPDDGFETTFDVAPEDDGDDDDDDDDDSGGGGGGMLPPTPDETDDDDDGPSAEITIDPETATVDDEVTFSASDSSYDGGELADYTWEIDGETYDGETVTERFSAGGTVDIHLEVATHAGNSDRVTDTLSVDEADSPDSDADDNEATADDEGDDTGSDDDSDDGVPGFGAVSAIVSLLAVIALFKRR
ncbi:S8 family serine peptidase [Natronorubrum daqingense]|uniref:PGF-CTERM protein n=1 Tax=Natronorubrum daqingense TaxID=588898 RepID=A0A1N7CGJ6_9EURY|nr:S8 family serine peptidase [Natronorubrum daqingense]APX96895.1 hypothetical protein BB347_09820 [Natronorubrum daqingense]SIR62690.1 PGF-CTERM protein [Natronorubrum daqingense]